MPSVCALIALSLVALASFAVPATLAGNCTLMQPLTMDTAGTMYEITGSHIRVYPKLAGVIRTDTYITWNLSMLVERSSESISTTGHDYAPRYKVIFPKSNNFFDPIEPLEPHDMSTPCTNNDADMPCSPIQRVVYLPDMDCWAETTSDVYHGFQRRTILVYLTHPSYPLLKLTAAHHLLDGDLQITHQINESTQTVREIYYKDTLKLAYIFENFPWSDTDKGVSFYNLSDGFFNNASALSFWSKLAVNIPFGTDVTLDKDREISNISITGIDDPLSIFLQLSEFFDADDFLWADFGPNHTLHRNFSLPVSTVFDLWVYSSILNGKIGHWQKLFYDPNFGTLFSGDAPTSTTPPSKSKIGKLPAWAVFLIVLAGVIAVVAVFAVVVVFVPAAKVLVRPFTQRSGKSTGSSTTTGDSGWQQARAPSRGTSKL